jgi:hypothetical protein
MGRERILSIVIYDDAHAHEREMRAQLERSVARLPLVRQLFVRHCADIGEIVERSGEIIVPGRETFVPGILHKTLEALAYCARNYAFDVCVRSNVSTVIDFARLPLGELDEGVQYASTYIWHGDAPFASGTNIFLSRAAVAYVLAHRAELDMRVIDDVALGALLRRVTTPVQLSVPMAWNAEFDGRSVVYRNRVESRADDVARMRRIVDAMLHARERTEGREGRGGCEGREGPESPEGPEGPRWLALAVLLLALTALYALTKHP